MGESVLKGLQLAPGQTGLALPHEDVSLYPARTEALSPEAAGRLHGHEEIVQEICSVAKKEAQVRGLSLLKIEVRPAWSHEYDEHNGVVIDIEIKADPDERFSYWDTLSEQVDQLETTLSPEDRSFLTDEIALVISRS